ncbi:MAG TPA: hypothetical protein VKU41_11040, partial [Polyangiaceae bacterium]|nr:hypothetical protein [Polyangiaceae bacterium]
MGGWRLFFTLTAGAVVFAVAASCSNGSSHATSKTPTGPSSGSLSSSGSTGPSGPPGSFPDAGTAYVSQVDGGVTTKLPSLPPLDNVVASLNDDSASITFEPVQGALDYRVYPLPKDSDVNVGSDGTVTIRNATYRCAGNRETPPPMIDNGPGITSGSIRTEVDNVMVGNYTRTMAEATLGYVYLHPGPGLTPVYALGDGAPLADGTCFFMRWGASRSKKYTTSDSERSQLLSNFSRDDGIVFYVPTTADATTTQVYFDDQLVGSQYQTRYYFPDGPEAAAHSNKSPAFLVSKMQQPGTLPLMRVFYSNSCGWSHDELVAGQERFNRVYKQGDQLPWWSLMWAGLTGPTTLVVEALDSGCPYQGHMSPQAIGAVTGMLGSMPIPHEPFITLDDMRAASPTGEVFINGQHDTKTFPKAIARSFVNVTTKPHPTMDFFADFSPNAAPETFMDIPCGVPGGNCFQTWRQVSQTWDQMFIDVESGPTPGSGLFAVGPIMGELWLTFADVSGDVNGKYRLTPKQKGTVSADSFLHVTMEADAYSTGRRYPQFLVSDQDIPVQYNLPNGHTLVIQTRAPGAGIPANYPVNYELQICNKRNWDVNNQCPVYDLYHINDSSGNALHIAPGDEVGEHASVDHRIQFDAYISSQRVYLFLDNQPYACANLPAGDVPSGPVTITWGDVLYHSAIDANFAFHAAHLQYDTRRHFDNLGFSSGVPAPGWDESRLPCAAPISL